MAQKAQRVDGTGPFVEITQVGRWTYNVSGVIDGIGIWARSDGDRVWGTRHRARRRALKRLARYRRDQQRQQDRTIVREEPT
jgi:hypothetical protein